MGNNSRNSFFQSDRHQLHSEKEKLEKNIENISAKFQKMWPNITEVVLNAPKYFSRCSLTECCDHVDTSYAEIITTNKELCNIIVFIHNALLDPTTHYKVEIEKTLANDSSLSDSLQQLIDDAQEIFWQVQFWASLLMKKNKPLYQLW